MTPRERFLATMHFETPDRVPYWEITGFWDETLERWLAEGLSAEKSIDESFGLDHWDLVPVDLDLLPAFPEELIEEDVSTQLVRQSDGVTRRIPKQGGLPVDVDFPVKSLNDFESLCAERLNPETPARYPENWSELVVQYRMRDYPIGLRLGYVVSWALELMGVENASMGFYDQPELMEQILQFAADFILIAVERACHEIPDIDFAFFRENITSNIGPMLSPRVIEQHVLPHYRRIVETLRGWGIDLVFMDSDGNCDALLPLWIEAGINGFYPLEIAAGEDPVRLREQYPDLRLIGGIDKRELARDFTAIERELETKVLPLLASGGWIPSLDHSVPPEVPLTNYQHYWKVLRQLAEQIRR